MENVATEIFSKRSLKYYTIWSMYLFILSFPFLVINILQPFLPTWFVMGVLANQITVGLLG